MNDDKLLLTTDMKHKKCPVSSHHCRYLKWHLKVTTAIGHSTSKKIKKET